ncbi:MAG TPA: radical SAM protein [Candidatus Methylomirabilis sp.]
MAPKVLIIQPSYYRSKTDRTVFKVRRRPVVSLTLPYLAALTPKGWDVQVVDEQLEDVNFDEPADVVAITVWTMMSYRAYDIADEFRRRGLPVVLGGSHTYFHADEGLQHADAVGIGEGETIWAQMLEDAVARRLQPIYRGAIVKDLSGLPMPRYELVDLRRYGPSRTYAIQASRGCPFRCDFCSERLHLGDAYRYRPVADVVEEVKRCGSKFIFFADSHFGGKRDHTMALMEALIPLKLRWSTLWTTYLCNDVEYMDLAQRSGLLHVNIGVESIEPDTLAGMNKRFNKVAKYGDMLANLRQRGISYSLNFIFGWDGESPDVFGATLRFLHAHKVPVAYFNLLTPEEGTPLFERLQAEGRLLDLADLGRWPGHNCYIKPKNASPQDLERTVDKLYRDFYTVRSMLARLPLPVTLAHLASWSLNLAQRQMVRTGRRLNNFDSF